MIRAGVDAQMGHLLAGQRALLGEHALDGLLEHALGEAAAQLLAGGDFLDAARVTGVAVVDLLVQLAASELHLVGVQDDDEVAAVDVRGVVRTMLAAKTHGDERGETANNGVLGIDHDPLLLDLGGLQRSRGLHHGSNSVSGGNKRLPT